MRPFFLAIEGAIGVGKTTLARLLQPRFGAELLLEAFEENPFLSGFYADRARYAFQTQMFFLLSRYRQQQVAPEFLARSPLIADYTFAKDSLFAQMNLAGDELDVYKQLYVVLADRIPVPDLVVYLRADTDLLMLRIATRDRAYEREMDRLYIESLRQAYEQYFSTYTQVPLLVIDANALDYVKDPSALAFIEGQVRTRLGIGAYQQSLPQMEPIDLFELLPGVSTEGARVTSGRDVVGEFLTASAAMGRVGAALADGATGWSESKGMELKTALQGAVGRLQRLAHAAGIDLPGDSLDVKG
ncbi:MAG: deoxynucleoside kinase [Chloroflexota bacterium]|nr:deoxynucleoside kinase [Chloroflexota bacterium]